MTDKDGRENWSPPRGRLFKVLVYVLLILIALGVLAMAVIALMG